MHVSSYTKKTKKQFMLNTDIMYRKLQQQNKV